MKNKMKIQIITNKMLRNKMILHKNRRRNLKNLEVFARLYINDQRVSETKPVKLKYPALEADLSEMFQVHVFTMPSSIQIELVIKDWLSIDVDKIDIEVPGQHVKTLTCACQLVQ